MKKCFAVFLLLASVSLAAASADPFLATDGYYYWKGYSTPYTRVYVPACSVSGCYQAAYYQYNPVVVQTVVKNVTNVITKDGNQQNTNSQVLQISREVAAAKLALVKTQQEHDNTIDLINKTGLAGAFGIPSYNLRSNLNYSAGTPAQMPYILEGNLYNSVFNGSTGYGRSYNTTAGPAYDPNLSSLQASLHIQDMTAAVKEAINTYGSTAGIQAKSNARIAEQNSRTANVLSIIAALQSAPTSELNGFSFKITPTGVTPINGNPESERKKLGDAFAANVQRDCFACHSGANLMGKLDMNQWPTFSDARKDAIRARVNPLADDSVRMPRAFDPANPKNTIPGKPLGMDNYRTYLLN